MSQDDWYDSGRRAFGALLGGDVGDRFISLQGYPELDDSFLLILNASHEPVEFTLPAIPVVRRWTHLIDTARPRPAPNMPIAPGSRLSIAARSLSLFAGHLNE